MKIPYDKKLHLFAGILLSSFGFLNVYLFSLGFIAGISKEIYDGASKKGKVELGDALYTIMGACIPCIFYLVCC